MTAASGYDDIGVAIGTAALGVPHDWERLRHRITPPTRAQVLEIAVTLSRAIPGNIVEFGVFEGESVRILRDELWRARLWDRRVGRPQIFACDSFQGLPDRYETLAAGTFHTSIPRLRGVRIVAGYFEDTLDDELAAEVGRVRLAHLDADLLESTRTALDWLTPLLAPGSLLLFDELLGDDPAEARALVEWCERTGTEVALLLLTAREPSSTSDRADRRALFQVVGDSRLTVPRPLFPVRVRRRLSRSW